MFQIPHTRYVENGVVLHKLSEGNLEFQLVDQDDVQVNQNCYVIFE